MRVPILVAICFVIGAASVSAAEQSVDETLGEWQILCFDDDIGQYRNCYAIRDDLSVLVSGRGYELVIVGHGSERRPGSDMVVRVDGNRPISWREDDLYADEAFSTAIRQFIAGTKVWIRWTERQSGKDVAREVSLIGFAKAYRRATQLAADYRP